MDAEMTAQIEIREFGIDDLTAEILEGVREVLDLAAHNSKMYASLERDLQEDHEVFRAYIAYGGSEAVGVVVVEDKVHQNLDYGSHKPVHLKRFAVHPEHRGKGLGKRLLDRAKEFAFEEVGLPILFGESNETGALAFYGREGALFSAKTIKGYSRRNSPEDNLRFFCRFITDKSFRRYRYPEGKGIPFVFCNDETVEREYRELGYRPDSELIREYLS